MQFVSGINRGGRGGSSSCKQICVMEESLMSNKITGLYKGMTVGVATDRSE